VSSGDGGQPDGSEREARRSRFPASVYRLGGEPDPRFSLANERTFLAWIRTALALIAVGVAVEALDLPVQPQLRLIAALVFIGLGLMAAAQAWPGWMRAERSLRQARPLPGLTVGLVLVCGVMLAAGLLAIGLFL
jgi:putative membrane protein